jgi:hypothetical protein
MSVNVRIGAIGVGRELLSDALSVHMHLRTVPYRKGSTLQYTCVTDDEDVVRFFMHLKQKKEIIDLRALECIMRVVRWPVVKS